MSEALKSVKNWVLALIILAIVIMAFFYPGSGLLSKVKDKSLSFLYFVGILKRDTYVAGAKAPKELEDSFNTLYEAIKTAKDDKECFFKYGKFPDLGLFQVIISYAETEEGNKFYLKLINPQKQILRFETIEGLKPCVVAGGKKITENFKKNWIDLRRPLSTGDYSEVQEIKFKFNRVGWNENEIYFNGIHKENNDHNLLYKPDKDHACFFATHDYGRTVLGDSIKASSLKKISERLTSADPKGNQIKECEAKK